MLAGLVVVVIGGGTDAIMCLNRAIMHDLPMSQCDPGAPCCNAAHTSLTSLEDFRSESA